MQYARPYTQIYMHVVWATWGRRPLVTADIEQQVYASIKAACRRDGAVLMAIGGAEDHVHVLIRMPTTVAVASLVQRMKGSTSHLINRIGPGRHRLRWQAGYGAFSVCKGHVPAVTRYILRQAEHHALGSTRERLEIAEDPTG